jgi:hypothetical protein
MLSSALAVASGSCCTTGLRTQDGSVTGNDESWAFNGPLPRLCVVPDDWDGRDRTAQHQRNDREHEAPERHAVKRYMPAPQRFTPPPVAAAQG